MEYFPHAPIKCGLVRFVEIPEWKGNRISPGEIKRDSAKLVDEAAPGDSAPKILFGLNPPQPRSKTP